MNRMQAQVTEFHRKFDLPIGDVPSLTSYDDVRLRARLLLEEALETVDAMKADDLVETADGLADVLYIVLGAAVSFGIDMEPIFDEVHRTNMNKEGGGRREDGKILKPKGWKPPRIRELLRDQAG